MKLSKETKEAVENFNQRKREVAELEAKLQASSTRLGELRTELSRLDYEKAEAAKDRKESAARLADTEITEDQFLKTRRQYAELSEQIDATGDLVEAFQCAVDELQRKLNDARAHVGIARSKAYRAYCAQIQAEVKSRCGDLILTGLAAKHGGGSQTGRDAMGYFLCGALTGNENRQPEYEEIVRLRSEIEKSLGIAD